MKATLTSHETHEPALFAVTADIVVFGMRGDALQVLLRREADSRADALWALPGGRVAASEGVDVCAGRALGEQTGIRDVYVEQLYTFGQPDRQRACREISVAYFALVDGDRAAAQVPRERVHWHAVEQLPALHLDHERIIQTARERLSAKLEYSTIAFQLMPEYFTLSELQQVYEAVHQVPIDKRNFRKRILALDHMEATEHKRCNGSHRPARLYRYTARDAIHYLK